MSGCYTRDLKRTRTFELHLVYWKLAINMTDLVHSREHMKGPIKRELSYADNPPPNAERLDKHWADFVAATIQMHVFSNRPDYVSPMMITMIMNDALCPGRDQGN